MYFEPWKTEHLSKGAGFRFHSIGFLTDTKGAGFRFHSIGFLTYAYNNQILTETNVDNITHIHNHTVKAEMCLFRG